MEQEYLVIREVSTNSKYALPVVRETEGMLVTEERYSIGVIDSNAKFRSQKQVRCAKEVKHVYVTVHIHSLYSCRKLKIKV